MIRVHDPEKLIKMIVRIIVQKVKVSHANILLHDKNSKSYNLKRFPWAQRPEGAGRIHQNGLFKSPYPPFP